MGVVGHVLMYIHIYTYTYLPTCISCEYILHIWWYYSCGNVNFSWREKCNKCGRGEDFNIFKILFSIPGSFLLQIKAKLTFSRRRELRSVNKQLKKVQDYSVLTIGNVQCNKITTCTQYMSIECSYTVIGITFCQ